MYYNYDMADPGNAGWQGLIGMSEVLFFYFWSWYILNFLICFNSSIFGSLEYFMVHVLQSFIYTFHMSFKVDGESLESSLSSSQKNEYTAILFYASWCPFSSDFQSKLSILSSMYPQIMHLMVEQSSSVPSIFSRYGIHSVPSLLMVNQTTRMRYYGRRDLPSLVNFYKRATGLNPMVDMVEDTSRNSKSEQKFFHFWNGASLKEIFLNEPYLVLSIGFVLSRAFLYFFPNVASHLMAMWVAYIPHLNLEIFGESRQFIGRVLHVIDVKRIWSKLKLCKTRNFHQGARNARVWASSLASVSLGQASSSRNGSVH